MSDINEINSLSGKVSAKDGLHWILSGGKIWKAPSICAVITFFLLLVITFLEFKSLPTFVIIELLYSSLIVFLVVTFSSLFCSVGIYFFLKSDQRHVAWSFSKDSFTLKDQAGNQIITPWAQVKVVRFNSKGVCIYCKPFGSRWVPNRLLPDSKMSEFKDLVKAVGVWAG